MLRYREILGQEKLKKYLYTARVQNRLPHAILLSGKKKSGKKTLANAFILDILCERVIDGSDKEPCLECHACKQVLVNSHPDVIRVVHEKPHTISVENIRTQIKDTIQIRPYSSKKKIYIIDEAEKMTQASQNALLKSLEEPPPYVIMILLSQNQDMLLKTIQSRCIKLAIDSIPEQIMREYLRNKFFLDEESLRELLTYANGNLGRAIIYMQDEKIRQEYNRMLHLFEKLHKLHIYECANEVIEQKESGMDIYELLDWMYCWYRDILIVKTIVGYQELCFKGHIKVLYRLARQYELCQLNRIFKSIERTVERLKANVNPEFTLQLLLMDCTLQ